MWTRNDVPRLLPAVLGLFLSAVAAHAARLADVVIVVDGSDSMQAEEAFVQQALNDFANFVSAAGVDLHLVLISDTSICAPAPLGTGACPDDEKLPAYRHVVDPVSSNNALARIVATFCQWVPSLRPGASRHFIAVSDDDSSVSATDFTSQLLALSPGSVGFGFHAIAASEDPNPFDPTCADTSTGGPPWPLTYSAAEGVVYKELVSQTGGVFHDLCSQDFLPGFLAIAAAIDMAAVDVDVPDITINELRIDQFGVDTDEYFELRAPPGTPLDTLTYVVLGDGAAGSGTFLEVLPLTGVVPASGLWVAAESGFTLLDPADPDQVQLVAPLAFDNGENTTHMLMSESGASVGDDADAADDGTAESLCGIPLDTVALIEEPNPPIVGGFHYGPPGECNGSDHCATVGPVAGAVPFHVRRCPDGGGFMVGDDSVSDPAFPDDSPGQPNHCPDSMEPFWSFHAGDGGNQQVRAMTVDANGNLFLAGGFDGSLDFGGGAISSQGSLDVFLVKLSPSGSDLGSVRYGDSAFQSATAVATDAGGNIVLAGSFSGAVDFGGATPTLNSMGSDIFVAKLDSGGDGLWSGRYGDGDVETPNAVTADRAGNVILAGHFLGNLSFGGPGLVASPQFSDMFLAKLDSNGNHHASASFGFDGVDAANAVAVDAAGNIYVTGSFQTQIDFGGGTLSAAQAGDRNAFLAKFDPDLIHLWSASFGGLDKQEGLALAVDASGSVILTGSFEGTIDLGKGVHTSAGAEDIFLAKFDASGQPLWSRSFGDDSADLPAGVAVGPGGSIALAGHFSGSIDFGDGSRSSAGTEDVFVARFSGRGELFWSEHFGDASSQQTAAVGLDDFAHTILTGRLQGTIDFGGGPLAAAGGDDVFVVATSETGTLVIATIFSDGFESGNVTMWSSSTP